MFTSNESGKMVKNLDFSKPGEGNKQKGNKNFIANKDRAI